VQIKKRLNELGGNRDENAEYFLRTARGRQGAAGKGLKESRAISWAGRQGKGDLWGIVWGGEAAGKRASGGLGVLGRLEKERGRVSPGYAVEKIKKEIGTRTYRARTLHILGSVSLLNRAVDMGGAIRQLITRKGTLKPNLLNVRCQRNREISRKLHDLSYFR